MLSAINTLSIFNGTYFVIDACNNYMAKNRIIINKDTLKMKYVVLCVSNLTLKNISFSQKLHLICLLKFYGTQSFIDHKRNTYCVQITEIGNYEIKLFSKERIFQLFLIISFAWIFCRIARNNLLSCWICIVQ